jgi:DNA polymerase
MNEVQREFLDILVDLRAHVEYQTALGVRMIEMPSDVRCEPTQTAEKSGNRSPAAAPRSGHQIPPAPPLPKRGEERPLSTGSTTLSAVREEMGDCVRCKLHRGRKTIVFGEGDPRASLLFVGEGPGAEEDEQGRPFVGTAGQLLTDIIVKGMGLRREDVYICNIVKCRPPENRNPEPDEIEACESFLLKQILAINPKVIVGLGNVACKTLLKTTEGITMLRGKWKTYHGIPLMPTFHPAYLLRNPKDKALVWKDIQLVMARLQKG